MQDGAVLPGGPRCFPAVPSTSPLASSSLAAASTRTGGVIDVPSHSARPLCWPFRLGGPGPWYRPPGVPHCLTPVSGGNERVYACRPMGLLDGRSAVVTGAGQGHGRDIALCLATEGARVVVNNVGVSLGRRGRRRGPGGGGLRRDRRRRAARPSPDHHSDERLRRRLASLIATCTDSLRGASTSW